MGVLNPLSTNPTKCQTYSNNSSGVPDEVLEYVLWGWRLKG